MGFLRKRFKFNFNRILLKKPDLHLSNQSGQLVVEYVLLLMVAVGMALIIRTALTKTADTPEDSGSIIRKWQSILNTIANDDPNKSN